MKLTNSDILSIVGFANDGKSFVNNREVKLTVKFAWNWRKNLKKIQELADAIAEARQEIVEPIRRLPDAARLQMHLGTAVYAHIPGAERMPCGEDNRALRRFASCGLHRRAHRRGIVRHAVADRAEIQNIEDHTGAPFSAKSGRASSRNRIAIAVP